MKTFKQFINENNDEIDHTLNEIEKLLNKYTNKFDEIISPLKTTISYIPDRYLNDTKKIIQIIKNDYLNTPDKKFFLKDVNDLIKKIKSKGLPFAKEVIKIDQDYFKRKNATIYAYTGYIYYKTLTKKEALNLIKIAKIRHEKTNYDKLLKINTFQRSRIKMEPNDKNDKNVWRAILQSIKNTLKLGKFTGTMKLEALQRIKEIENILK